MFMCKSLSGCPFSVLLDGYLGEELLGQVAILGLTFRGAAPQFPTVYSFDFPVSTGSVSQHPPGLVPVRL